VDGDKKFKLSGVAWGDRFKTWQQMPEETGFTGPGVQIPTAPCQRVGTNCEAVGQSEYNSYEVVWARKSGQAGTYGFPASEMKILSAQYGIWSRILLVHTYLILK
jgi:hypothetical protein